MAVVLRHLVSTNKRRYKDDAYDLDLSYIVGSAVPESAKCVGIIAMGYPSSGLRSIIRNPLPEVRSLFDSRYVPGRVCVYNLCIERGWQYEASKLGTTVVELPLWDGQAPPLTVIHQFCQSATAWLNEHPGGCVAVHCKAGKGRTGALVVALLMYLVKHGAHLIPEVISHLRAHPQQPGLGDNIPGLVLPLLQYWGEKRTKDGKGLTISSQRRYVSYYASVLQKNLGDAPAHPVHLSRLLITGLTNPNGGLMGCWSAAGAASSTNDNDDDAAMGAKVEHTAPQPLPSVPSLTIALWVRPNGTHTPYLAAYGTTHAGSSAPRNTIRKPPLHLPVEVLPDGSLSMALQPLSLMNTTTGLLTPVVVPRLAPEAIPKSRLASVATTTTLSSTTSNSSSVPAMTSNFVIPANGSTTTSNGNCSTTTLPPGMLIDGDFKIQVFQGAQLPTDTAAFKSGGSLLYTWLHTAFLDDHNRHAVHSMRPDMMASVGDAVIPEKSVRYEGAQRVVRVTFAELDKVHKQLRGNGRLGVQVSYY